MYTPEPFRVSDEDAILDLLECYPFATLVSTRGGALTVTHLPLLLDRQARAMYGHVARANPHWSLLEEAEDVRLVFLGPHGYVSPNWYFDSGLVPTWNYLAVHVTGRAVLLDDPAQARMVVSRLSARHEANFERPWTLDKLPAERIDALLRAIVAFRVDITGVEGKAKLGQNRPQDAEGAIAGLRATTGAPLAHELADHMARALEKAHLA